MHLRYGRLADAALVAAAAAVVLGAAFVATRTPRVPVAEMSQPATHVVLATPTSPAAQQLSAPAPVLLIGRDLAKAATALSHDLERDVVTAPASTTAVVTAPSLDAVTVTPDVVVLQVLAGTRTTQRTTAALDLVQARFPGVQIYVVGPFSPKDPKSEAAVKSAAHGRAVFVDPITDRWGATPTAQFIAQHVADALRAPAT